MKRSILPLLAALFTGSLFSQASAQTTAPPAPEERVDYIHLREGELPSVSLSAEILYRLLVAEIAATRGQYDVAASTTLQLAQQTSDPRLARRAFQFSMAERNMVRALESARLWALLAPKDPEAVASSLALAASSGQTNGLASALKARIERATDKSQAVAQASVIVAKMQDKALALSVLEQALGPDLRKLAIARLALADAAWAADQPERALAEARRAQAIEPGSDAAAQRVLEYGLKVDPDRAIADTRAFLKAHGGSRQLQLMFVNRLVLRKNYDLALQQISAMRQAAPEDFDLMYTEAEVQMRAENFTRAEALLQEYIQVQSQRQRSLDEGATNAQANVSDARLMLVQIAEKRGDIPAAIAQLDRIDDTLLRFQAQVHKAVLQARQGEMALARSTLDRLKPQNDRERSVVALTLASIFQEAGRTDAAVDTLQRANQEIPGSPQIKYDLAMLYERQGKVEEFETLMREVIDLDPDNANAYNSLGYTFADQNRNLEEAQALLDRALELDPENPYIQDSVGWFFYRTGDLQAALEYLERSYRQLPAAEVAAHLGEVLWALGRRDDARRIWNEGLDLDADNRVLRETMQRFGVSRP